MFTVAEFKERFIEDGEVDLPKYCLVYEERIVDHKLIIYTEVWNYFGQFFEVTYTRDNSGYWGEGESYPVEVQKVFPKEVTKTIYVVKETNAL